jgi:rod shape-determining protein MreB and related proteins
MSGLGMDVGTASTVVCHSRKGVVVDEPTVMALRHGRRQRTRLVAVGHDARDLIGRVPMGLSILRPVQDGAVTDSEPTRTFLRTVLHQQGLRRWERLRSKIGIAVPLGATNLECRALLEAAEDIRLRHVALVPAPIAGAVGCGIDPMDRRTHLVVDIGAGTSEVVAFAYGGVIAYRSSRLGGDEMTLAVHQYLRQAHQVIVGELVAEEIKTHVGAEDSPSLVVEGQDAATGRPHLVAVSVEEVMDAVRPVTDTIVQTLAACLYDLPAQVMGDLTSEGVLAFGGGCLFRGFDKALEGALGFSVRLAEHPTTCVAEGTTQLLERPDALRTLARA